MSPAGSVRSCSAVRRGPARLQPAAGLCPVEDPGGLGLGLGWIRRGPPNPDQQPDPPSDGWGAGAGIQG
eukprot:scaffold7064_cov175-Prasinococcus_capsulatus_cf.AAC.1